MTETPTALPPPGRAALGFAVAALAACWNPFAAPLGLVVGIAAAVLAFRALRRAGGRRRIPAAALALSLLAVVASALLLIVTAGTIGVDLPGEPVLKARTPEELERVLSEAAERTRPERERARAELERLAGAPSQAKDGGAVPRAAPDGGGAVPGAPPDGGAR
jgi:hypothetical protein